MKEHLNNCQDVHRQLQWKLLILVECAIVQQFGQLAINTKYSWGRRTWQCHWTCQQGSDCTVQCIFLIGNVIKTNESLSAFHFLQKKRKTKWVLIWFLFFLQKTENQMSLYLFFFFFAQIKKRKLKWRNQILQTFTDVVPLCLSQTYPLSRTFSLLGPGHPIFQSSCRSPESRPTHWSVHSQRRWVSVECIKSQHLSNNCLRRWTSTGENILTHF